MLVSTKQMLMLSRQIEPLQLHRSKAVETCQNLQRPEPEQTLWPSLEFVRQPYVADVRTHRLYAIYGMHMQGSSTVAYKLHDELYCKRSHNSNINQRTVRWLHRRGNTHTAELHHTQTLCPAVPVLLPPCALRTSTGPRPPTEPPGPS